MDFSVHNDKSRAKSLTWIYAHERSTVQRRLHGYQRQRIRHQVSTVVHLEDLPTKGYRSDLPIIVSLEVHTSVPQQEIMVEIIKSTFKNYLVDTPTKPIRILPSPAALRNKILIKVKYVAPEKAASKASAAAQASQTLQHKSSAASGHSSASSNADDTPVPTSGQKRKENVFTIIPALSDLGIYTCSYHFSSLSSPSALIPVHVFSLSEKKIMEVHQSSGPTLFSHNRNYLMRAFPSGLRVRSDNLDPSVFWRKGVQMAALNWQRWDEGMMLNEGMFTGSGGWVLKPRGYLGHRDNATPGHIKSQNAETTAAGNIGDESQASAITHKILTLAITILAAQDIPLPLGGTNPAAFHPYVKVELHVEKPAERSGAPIEGGGISKDEGLYKQRTRTGKGTDADFGGEVVRFRDVPGVVDELSFVRYDKLHLIPLFCFHMGWQLRLQCLYMLFTRSYLLFLCAGKVHSVNECIMKVAIVDTHRSATEPKEVRSTGTKRSEEKATPEISMKMAEINGTA